MSSGRPCSDPELVELGVILRVSIMDSPSGRFCFNPLDVQQEWQEQSTEETDMFGTTI